MSARSSPFGAALISVGLFLSLGSAQAEDKVGDEPPLTVLREGKRRSVAIKLVE